MNKRNMLGVLSCVTAGWLGAVSPMAEYTFDGDVGGAKVSGPVHYVNGAKDRAIVLKNSTVTMPCPAGLTPAEGTISLWIKPLDWDDSVADKIVFLDSRTASGARLCLAKDSQQRGGRLMFAYGTPGKPGAWMVVSPKGNETLVKGQWQWLAVSWSRKAGQAGLFLNGQRIATQSLTGAQLFPAFASFVINAGEAQDKGGSHETAFDLVRFYPQAVADDELSTVYESEAHEVKTILKTALLPTILSIPKLSTVPKIDGLFRQEEWSGAVRAGGMLHMDTFQLIRDTPFDVYVGCDDSKLYFCFTGKIADAVSLKNERSKRDTAVYSDDSWEIHMITPEMASTEVCQGVFNYSNAIYDSLNSNVKWDGNWQVKSSIYEGYWYCEVSFPFSDLKSPFRQDSIWKFNLCRNLQNDEHATFDNISLSPSAGTFAGNYGQWRLTEKDSFGRLTVDYEQLAKRKLNVKMEAFNQSAQPQVFKATVQKLYPDGQPMAAPAVMTRKVPAGKGYTFSYDDPLTGFSSGIFRVTLLNGKGTIVHRQDVPMTLKDQVAINMETKLATDTLEFSIDMNSHYKLGRTASIEASILAKDGSSLTVRPQVTANTTKGVFDLTKVTPGDTHVKFVFKDGEGHKLLTYTEFYKHIGQPPWLKEHAGANMGVIAPYTPIRRKGDTLCVLGREHQFGSTLLPEQITSQGVKLFSQAPVLKATYDGKQVVFDNVQFRRVKDADDETLMSFSASAGKLAISGTVKLEYDGFFWYEFSLNQPQVTLESLSLEMRMPEAVAKYLNAHFYDRENYVGKLRPPMILKQIPSIWLGNEDVGLTMVIESFQHWKNANTNAAFTMVSRGHDVVWTARLVDKATALAKRKLTYGFGLEANPVKPLPKNFRSVRVNSFYNRNVAHPWDISYPRIKKYKGSLGFHTPEHESMEMFKEEVERFRKSGMELSLYLNPYLLSTESTEYKTFLKQWRNPYSGYPLCPGSGFTDYTTWQIQDHIRRGGLRCVYVDSLGAYNCANPLHGCGYVDEQGKEKLTWPIRGMRNYMKRLYSLIHAPGFDSPNNHVWGHMSARTSAPIDAFVDFQCSGEELETLIMNNTNYLELYSLDEFQIFFNRSSGVTPMLLPNLGRCGPKPNRYMPKYNDQLLALSLLHDVLIWISWCDESYVNDIYRIVDAFGYMDPELEFHSYRSQKLVATNASQVYISVYTLGKKAMAVIVNKNKTARDVQVNLDFEQLGIPETAPLVDMREKKPLPQGNPLKLTIPGYNFKLLQIGK